MGREPGPPLPASSSSSPWPDCPRCVVSVAPRSAHPSPTPLAPQRLLSVSVLVTPGFLHGVPISHVRDIARGCPHSQKHPLPLRGARLASQRGHRLCPPPGPEASGLQPLRGVMNPARLAPAGFVAPATPEGAEPPEPQLRKPRSWALNAVQSVTVTHVLRSRKNSEESPRPGPRLPVRAPRSGTVLQ